MDSLQTHRTEMISIGVALVAIAAATAYYYYITSSKKPKGCLDPDNFKEFKLVKRTQLSHNVAKFRFALPTPNSVLGLPIGQHLSCRGKDSAGEEVVKPYTPTTLDSDLGHFDLVIKMYPQGRMSHHFREMQEGEYLSVKGPKGRFKYQPNQVRAFGMIAGGTGITPMFQVTRAILENANDKTNIHLIYANVTYEDILLKEELDNFAVKFPNRFSVYYVLNQLGCLIALTSFIYQLYLQPPEGWNGGIGFVSREMIETHLPKPATDIKILRCGPPPMNKAMAAHLNELAYAAETQFQF
ncbi:NADH-cytochrome b5 reductase [Turnera subulata]|uniref:cytochrome-b5 reductase n=1 Tax=Turnera subulata TaxID=218843 RepID=A0A9Q0JAW6_9ROSI|nr:NADH-cytochrome b5 reductase [Turnera subulata]